MKMAFSLLIIIVAAITSCKNGNAPIRTYNKDTVVDKYFYPDGKLRKELHRHYTSGDSLFDGYVYEFYPSGNRKIKGGYRDGVKDKIWVWYSEDGKMERTSFFIDGKEFGGSFTFFKNGNIEKYRFRTNDEQVMYIRDYDSLGSILREEGFPFALSYGDTSLAVNQVVDPWVYVGLLADWEAKILIREVSNGATRIVRDTTFVNAVGRDAYLRELIVRDTCKSKGVFLWTIDITILDKKYKRELEKTDTFRFIVR